MSTIIEANDQTFDSIVKSEDIVVVDFWADWCSSCKSFLKLFEKLANRFSNEAIFVKVNLSVNFMLSAKYNIQAIPSVIVFKGGNVLKTIIGIKPEQEYVDIITNILNSNNKTTMANMNNIIEVKGVEEFTKTIEANRDKLVIADFWAPWCGPCRMLAPTLEKIAEDYENEVVIIKVNVDEMENQQLAMQFQVSSIPTIAFIKEGEQTEITVGALPYDQLKEIIDRKKGYTKFSNN